MPSTYKTENLGLNKWIGTDKPKRADFCADNELIDEALTAHIENSAVHATAEEKAKWTTPFVWGEYTGDGDNNREFNLAFKPSFVMVFPADAAPARMDFAGGEQFVKFGAATRSSQTRGVSLTETGFKVINAPMSPPDKETPRFNLGAVKYFYVAFR